MLLDHDEASGLVEATRWIGLGDTQTEGAASLGDAGFDEIQEKLSSGGE